MMRCAGPGATRCLERMGAMLACCRELMVQMIPDPMCRRMPGNQEKDEQDYHRFINAKTPQPRYSR
jgi:hypothetical protein